MRKIVTMENGKTFPLSDIGVSTRKDILRVWTLYDKNMVLDNGVFSVTTGQPVTGLENANLQHLNGVFIEDYVHDWNIRNNQFHIYSRTTKVGDKITLIIELTS